MGTICSVIFEGPPHKVLRIDDAGAVHGAGHDKKDFDRAYKVHMSKSDRELQGGSSKELGRTSSSRSLGRTKSGSKYDLAAIDKNSRSFKKNSSFACVADSPGNLRAAALAKEREEAERAAQSKVAWCKSCGKQTPYYCSCR
mmetsp:Transcript_57513/g.117713  ORF Transcript_57513/g.117713 Transcript_57513/m.117713 type:complete len:142 (+) Transcript_57513:311-736(+)